MDVYSVYSPDEAPGFSHWGWWVGRTFQPMYYWGGAAPGSGKCECGLTEVGCAGNKPLCNCDSKLNETDEGQIQHKDYLPILELHFGDTGTAVDDKIGYHKVDKLECRGDSKPLSCFTLKCMHKLYFYRTNGIGLFVILMTFNNLMLFITINQILFVFEKFQ